MDTNRSLNQRWYYDLRDDAQITVIENRLRHIRSLHGLEYPSSLAYLFTTIASSKRISRVVPNIRHISARLLHPHPFFITLAHLHDKGTNLTYLEVSIEHDFQIDLLLVYIRTAGTVQSLSLDAPSLTYFEYPTPESREPCLTLTRLSIHCVPGMIDPILSTLPTLPNLAIFHCHLARANETSYNIPWRTVERGCSKFLNRGHTLREIAFTSSKSPSKLPFIVPIFSKFNSAIWSLASLKILHLGIAPHIQVDRHLLTNIATNLSIIETVDLIGLSNAKPASPYLPDITLADVASFASECPYLHTLAICFDGRLPTIGTDEMSTIMPPKPWTRRSVVKRLHVGGSLIRRSQALDVTLYFEDVFPQLSDIYCANEDYFIMDGVYHVTAWREVAHMYIGPNLTSVEFHPASKYHNYDTIF
jgi:hypothetical protein